MRICLATQQLQTPDQTTAASLRGLQRFLVTASNRIYQLLKGQAVVIYRSPLIPFSFSFNLDWATGIHRIIFFECLLIVQSDNFTRFSLINGI